MDIASEAASEPEIHSDCGSCASSQTSTDLYDHEPYQSFVHKAQSLLTSIFPKDLPIEMERMAGGSYNRVVGGILRHNLTDPMPVILRIPRVDYLQPVDEVAVLRYLTQMTDIPAPRVLHFDPTLDNAISSPYMVLSRLSGRCLEHVYLAMPFEKKRQVVCNVAHLLGKFSNVSFETIGMLRAGSEDEDVIIIGQGWDESEHFFPRMEGTQTPRGLSKSIASYLEERWTYFVNEEQRRNPGDSFDARYTAAFRTAASKLPIPNPDIRAQIVLFHTDFAPRNIFVDEDTGEITGVLDWDRAESAPAEAAWTMPAWLWDHNAGGSNQLGWESPDKIPEEPRAAELRDLFLREIGNVIPNFVDVVRGSKLLHELLIFARLGLHSCEIIERADEFLKGMGVEVAR
jgi:hypothetical protein